MIHSYDGMSNLKEPGLTHRLKPAARSGDRAKKKLFDLDGVPLRTVQTTRVYLPSTRCLSLRRYLALAQVLMQSSHAQRTSFLFVH